MNKKYLGYFLLIITTMVWGGGFVAQSQGMDHLGPSMFNALRSFIGSIALIPLFYFMDLANSKKISFMGASSQRKSLIIGGLLCGIALGAAGLCQQIGIKYTSVGKAGFITTLYIMIVPLLGLLLGHKCKLITLLCVIMALFGFYLMSFTGGISKINQGDLYCFCCAILFSIHILVIAKFAPHVDCIRLSSLQFLVAGIVSLIISFLTEETSLQDIQASLKPILYAGLISSGIGYTFQVIAQKWVHPTVASLIMSMESIFAILFGWLILHQVLSTRELCGCAIIFVAVIITTIKE